MKNHSKKTFGEILGDALKRGSLEEEVSPNQDPLHSWVSFYKEKGININPKMKIPKKPKGAACLIVIAAVCYMPCRIESLFGVQIQKRRRRSYKMFLKGPKEERIPNAKAMARPYARWLMPSDFVTHQEAGLLADWHMYALRQKEWEELEEHWKNTHRQNQRDSFLSSFG